MPLKQNHLFGLVVLIIAVSIGGFWFVKGGSPSITEPAGQPTSLAEPSAGEPGKSTASEAEMPMAPLASLGLENPSKSMLEQFFPPGDPAWAWSKVDLDSVKEALPDNLYWETSAPTEDPATLEKREKEKEYWNKMYGKVLSNTGTEEEVRSYYERRNRVSMDHVEFTGYMIQRYGDVIPERDLGLLQLARKLHLSRLEELPRELEEALKRREAHEKARQAWLAGEAEFKAKKPKEE